MDINLHYCAAYAKDDGRSGLLCIVEQLMSASWCGNEVLCVTLVSHGKSVALDLQTGCSRSCDGCCCHGSNTSPAILLKVDCFESTHDVWI